MAKGIGRSPTAALFGGCITDRSIKQALILVAALAFVLALCSFSGGKDIDYGLAFDGQSSDLGRTEIVAAFESPMPAGHNVVWCSAFQVAWDMLAEDVFDGPIGLEGAEAVAGLLNRSRASEADLAPESYFAAAGRATEGLVESIDREMAARFPDAAPPDFVADENNFLAYAYLSVAIGFAHPYFDEPHGLIFRDSAGGLAEVAAFGVGPDDDDGRAARAQVEPLFYGEGDDGSVEFAVDLGGDSRYRIVAARVAPRGTLADTCDYVAARASEHPQSGAYRTLGEDETLSMPAISWRIVHRFGDLENRPFLNDGFRRHGIADAVQMIEFRLDREGVVLRSEAEIQTYTGIEAAAPGRREFIFDRPFLLYVALRSAENPVFAVWIDNEELLVASE